MQPALSQPRLLLREDLPVAVEIMAGAFQNDPLWCAMFADVAQREVLLRRFFKPLIAVSIAGGRAYGAGNPLGGVAVWEFSGQPSSRIPRSALRPLLRLAASPFLPASFKVRPVFAAFGRMHSQYAVDPHHYLQTIGVAPQAQGRGLSSLLIRPFMRQAAERGQGVYTETMTPANVALYEHFGMACMEEAPIDGTGLCVWSFYRPKP